MLLERADGSLYVIIVDTSGQAQYDPVKVDSGNLGFWSDTCSLDSWHGYLSVTVDDERIVLDTEGEETDLSALDALGEDYALAGRTVRDGFWRKYDDAAGKYCVFIGTDGSEIRMVSIPED